MSALIRTARQLAAWCEGAAQQFDDPATPICQLFFRWNGDFKGTANGDDRLLFGVHEGEIVLWLGPEMPGIPLPIVTGGPVITDGALQCFGAVEISLGVWALAPSMNVPGLIHGFVVLYDLPPTSAPWDRRILVPH